MGNQMGGGEPSKPAAPLGIASEDTWLYLTQLTEW
jgi:hypothetical protein